MRIVFMGTPDFAVPCLGRLLEDGHEIVGVFTQPDKPRGRGYKLAPPPVKVLALEHGLPVYQPASLRDGEALAQMRELAPALIVAVAYGKLLPPALLALPPLGCINVHGSLLPRFRGAAPIQWSVLSGDRMGGVTTMFIAEGLDTGDLILQREVEIGQDETSGELYERLAIEGAQALSETVRLIAEGDAQAIPQQEADATRAPMLTKEMARIDFARPAREVHKLICGMNPWPMAHTTLEGRRLKVLRSREADGQGIPGTLLERKRMLVACGDGAVELVEVQPEGGKRMGGADYLRGRPPAPGVRFGEPEAGLRTNKEGN